MVFDPDLDFETDTEDLSPEMAHDRFESVTNLDAEEMRDMRDTKEHELYLEQNSDQAQGDDNPPLPGGPLDDALHLAETPADEWGEDEAEEFEELENYGSRAVPQFDPDEGEDLTPGDGQKITKADVALARWGFDMRPDDGWP